MGKTVLKGLVAVSGLFVLVAILRGGSLFEMIIDKIIYGFLPKEDNVLLLP